VLGCAVQHAPGQVEGGTQVTALMSSKGLRPIRLSWRMYVVQNGGSVGCHALIHANFKPPAHISVPSTKGKRAAEAARLRWPPDASGSGQ
jgi:hypothetical protein